MNELIVDNRKIENLIYEVRDKEVMLDSDLARLYGYSQGTKALNQAVKRNQERFPEDFFFQLTEKEYISILNIQNERLYESKLRSQFVTAKNMQMTRRLPYVFTEQGVAMLSSILRTPNAAQISIAIMRAFVSMRHFIIENQNIYLTLNNINNTLKNHENHLLALDAKVNNLFDQFNKKEESKEKIYFNGQIYDAYSKLMDTMSKAKKELVIIDNYADKSVLDMICDLKVQVKIITKANGLLKKLDLKKYQEQYHNLEVYYDNTFHDRYLILDENTIYHCGASLNKIGVRTFSINKLEDDDVKNALLERIHQITQNI